MSELLEISSKTNTIVYYLNDNLQTNYTDIQDYVKKLILEKYNNSNSDNRFEKFDDFIKNKLTAANPKLQDLSNIDILNTNTQGFILSFFGFDNSFEDFIKSSILEKINSQNSFFNDFNDFYAQAQTTYYTLNGLANFYKNLNISQMQSEEKQKIISRFENLPQNEKYKFDLNILKSLDNRNLELLLINQINANIKIINKDDEFKSYFQYLFFYNEELSDDNLNLLENFSENYANRNKEETFIKDPFLRLYAFLQLGGNLYDDKGELDPNKVGKIISNQDYEDFQSKVKNLEKIENELLNIRKSSQYSTSLLTIEKAEHNKEIPKDSIKYAKAFVEKYNVLCDFYQNSKKKYSCFLHFYQCLDNVKLNTYDLTLVSNFQKILSPLELFKNALKRSPTLIASIIFIQPYFFFFLFIIAAFTCIVGAIVCPIPTLSVVAGLSFFVFMLGAVDSLIVDIKHNKKIKREQNQFKQKTKEDITKKIEIGKKEDITQETQKEANQKNTNDVNTSLLIKIDKNKNKNSSDDSISLSSLSDENELSDSL